MTKDGRRYLIASGVSRYDKLPVSQQLDSVLNDIERVVALFESFGYERILPELSNSPTAAEFRKTLSEWFFSNERRPDDVVVLYHSGHGTPDREGNHYLLGRDSDPDPRLLPHTAFEADALGQFIAESKVQQVLVILDTCYSGAGAGRIHTKLASLASPGLLDPSRVDPDHRAGVWLLSAALPTQRARESVFSKALEQAVTLLLDDPTASRSPRRCPSGRRPGRGCSRQQLLDCATGRQGPHRPL